MTTSSDDVDLTGVDVQRYEPDSGLCAMLPESDEHRAMFFLAALFVDGGVYDGWRWQLQAEGSRSPQLRVSGIPAGSSAWAAIEDARKRTWGCERPVTEIVDGSPVLCVPMWPGCATAPSLAVLFAVNGLCHQWEPDTFTRTYGGTLPAATLAPLSVPLTTAPAPLPLPDASASVVLHGVLRARERPLWVYTRTTQEGPPGMLHVRLHPNVYTMEQACAWALQDSVLPLSLSESDWSLLQQILGLLLTDTEDTRVLARWRVWLEHAMCVMGCGSKMTAMPLTHFASMAIVTALLMLNEMGLGARVTIADVDASSTPFVSARGPTVLLSRGLLDSVSVSTPAVLRASVQRVAAACTSLGVPVTVPSDVLESVCALVQLLLVVVMPVVPDSAWCPKLLHRATECDTMALHLQQLHVLDGAVLFMRAASKK
jgi:hypothetical protein